MKSKVFIITGGQGSGKTTFLERIIKHYRAKGLIVAGIIAHGYWENNVRTAFELENLISGDKIVLCQTIPAKGWQKFRRFYFNPEGFDFGIKALEPGYVKDAGIIVIDEVGPLELEGKGWDESIKKLLNNSGKYMIWTVRESLVHQVIEHYKIKKNSIMNITNDSLDQPKIAGLFTLFDS